MKDSDLQIAQMIQAAQTADGDSILGSVPVVYIEVFITFLLSYADDGDAVMKLVNEE